MDMGMASATVAAVAGATATPLITHGTVASSFKDFDYDTCLLGIFNGTLPDGRHGNGSYTQFGVYAPTSTEKKAYGSPKYATYTILFITVTMVVFMLQGLLERCDRRRRMAGKSSPFILLPLMKARARRWAYLRGEVFGMTTPTLGVSLLLAAFFAYTNIYVWGVRPYYRPHNFGSPPLGLRSEWVATAMIPFMYALATKRNFVSIVTGISYGTLMVIHQWSAQICLFFSFVHTVAMIIRVTPIEPWSYTLQHRTTYWTGFAALSQLFVLCLLSLGPIRRYMYETFYWLHMLSAFGFLAFMFPHCLDGWVLPTTSPLSMLDSWSYLWAGVALWFAAITWRVGAIVYHTRFFTAVSRAGLTLLPGNALRITVTTAQSHTAGQHFFLRFPTIEPFGSHPFTVANAPRPPSFQTPNTIDFVIRPGKGLTARLFALASKSPIKRLPVVLDGPYGGEQVDSLRACSTVLLFAGGAGITAVAPVAEALAESASLKSQTMEKLDACACRTIVVVWAARSHDAFGRFSTELNALQMRFPGVSIKLHNTSLSDSMASASASSSQSDLVDKPSTSPFEIREGRPDVQDIVVTEALAACGRLGVLVCGPEGLCNDVRRAVVDQQRLILAGAANIEECELHEELFSY